MSNVTENKQKWTDLYFLDDSTKLTESKAPQRLVKSFDENYNNHSDTLIAINNERDGSPDNYNNSNTDNDNDFFTDNDNYFFLTIDNNEINLFPAVGKIQVLQRIESVVTYLINSIHKARLHGGVPKIIQYSDPNQMLSLEEVSNLFKKRIDKGQCVKDIIVALDFCNRILHHQHTDGQTINAQINQLWYQNKSYFGNRNNCIRAVWNTCHVLQVPS
jgi:hypothetical protein